MDIGQGRKLIIAYKEGQFSLEDSVRKIILSEGQWYNLTNALPGVTSAIQDAQSSYSVDFSKDLGDGLYISYNSTFPCAHVRQFDDEHGHLIPTKNGITLRLVEWGNFKNTVIIFSQRYLPSCDTIDGPMLNMQIGEKERFIQLMYWMDDYDIHLMQWKNGSARAVTFPFRRWAKLCYMKDIIDDIIKKVKDQETEHQIRHIGGRVYVTVDAKYPGVDLRHYFIKNNVLKPTRKGMRLTFSEWDQLKTSMDDINTHIPNLKDTVPCDLKDDHQSSLASYRCFECNPNAANSEYW